MHTTGSCDLDPVTCKRQAFWRQKQSGTAGGWARRRPNALQEGAGPRSAQSPPPKPRTVTATPTPGATARGEMGCRTVWPVGTGHGSHSPALTGEAGRVSSVKSLLSIETAPTAPELCSLSLRGQLAPWHRAPHRRWQHHGGRATFVPGTQPLSQKHLWCSFPVKHQATGVTLCLHADTSGVLCPSHPQTCGHSAG